ARELAHRELLKRNSGVLQQGKRAALEFAIGPDHPQDSGREEEFPLPRGFVLLPEIERPRREFRVRLVGPICPADNPRLPARRSPRISRTPGIQQRDPSPTAKKIKGSPSAKRARANDCDMRLGSHLWK